MDKIDLVCAFENNAVAIRALSDLRDSIGLMRACGCGIPSNAEDYIARINQWLISNRLALKQQLALDS